MLIIHTRLPYKFQFVNKILFPVDRYFPPVDSRRTLICILFSRNGKEGAFFSTFHKNLKLKWLKIIIILLSALISIIFLAMVMISTTLFMPHTYVELLSEDESHNIIIGEDCYFFSPYGGDVFEKTSFCTMKKLEKYVAKKDFYTPFSDGKYSITWNAENFELFYDSDGDGEKDEKMLIEYLP